MGYAQCVPIMTTYADMNKVVKIKVKPIKLIIDIQILKKFMKMVTILSTIPKMLSLHLVKYRSRESVFCRCAVEDHG